MQVDSRGGAHLRHPLVRGRSTPGNRARPRRRLTFLFDDETRLGLFREAWHDQAHPKGAVIVDIQPDPYRAMLQRAPSSGRKRHTTMLMRRSGAWSRL